MTVAKTREARTDNETEADLRRIQRVRRETLRRGLIKVFVAQQLSVCTHLCLLDIAKQWAPLRRESTLKAAKEAALDDLMEAVSDGHISELLFLNERAAVESVIASPWCQDAECPLNAKNDTTEFPCRLDAKWFADMRRTGEGISSFHLYLREKFAPDCWARREAVVTFLSRLGVDRTDLPAIWLRDDSFADVANAVGAGAIKRARKPSPVTEERTDKDVYLDWIAHNQGKRPPTRNRDRDHMRRHFTNITQDRLRWLRRDLAPSEWTKRGRPKK